MLYGRDTRPGLAARRVAATWGAGRQADISLAGSECLSLPLHPGDWAGGPRLLTLELSMSAGDAVPLRDLDPRSADSRRRDRMSPRRPGR